MRVKLFLPLALVLALLLVPVNQSCLALESNTQATTASFARIADAKSAKSGSLFRIIVLPDSQCAIEKWPEIYEKTIRWIADNRDALNIKQVIHVGDGVQTGTKEEEWQRFRKSMKELDKKIPYVVAMGNHDGVNRREQPRKAANLNKYFPLAEMKKIPGFVGSFPKDGVENIYRTFSGGGLNWLVIALEFMPTDEELEWANKVVAEHPRHQVIIATHSYLTHTGRDESGKMIWDKLVRKHKNILFVFCGHLSTVHYDDPGDKGNQVYQMLFDWQNPEKPDMNTYFAMIEVDTQAGTISVKSYSPYLDNYLTDPRGRFEYKDVRFLTDQPAPLTSQPASPANQPASPASQPAPRDLLGGAKAAYSVKEEGDGKQQEPDTTQEVVFTSPGKRAITAIWDFRCDEPGAFETLSSEKPVEIEKWQLNGKQIALPLEGMRYDRIPAVPCALLVKGENRLAAEWTVDVRKEGGKMRPEKIAIRPRLLGNSASSLDFQTWPVLGFAGTDFLTLSCRTNMPARVTLKANGCSFQSEAGLLHTFKVDGLKAGAACSYSLTAELPNGKARKKIGPFKARTLPTNNAFTFAAIGDSRGKPEDWARVADAVLKARPAFVTFSGDMVYSGRLDHIWDRNFFAPARSFMSSLPTYYVLGNHEENAPLVHRMFQVPGDFSRWSQVVGPVLLIGIDGGKNWDGEGENYKWLKGVLAASGEKWIFLVTHYPAWTSGPHGDVLDGKPREHPTLQGQQHLMPLLKEYNATAMIAGHDHDYERSEPPNGVSAIVTGGAGAPLYKKAARAAEQNPYSKTFASKFHYCLFTIDGNTCKMRVLTPEGERIDSAEWPARKVR